MFYPSGVRDRPARVVASAMLKRSRSCFVSARAVGGASGNDTARCESTIKNRTSARSAASTAVIRSKTLGGAQDVSRQRASTRLGKVCGSRSSLCSRYVGPRHGRFPGRPVAQRARCGLRSRPRCAALDDGRALPRSSAPWRGARTSRGKLTWRRPGARKSLRSPAVHLPLSSDDVGSD